MNLVKDRSKMEINSYYDISKSYHRIMFRSKQIQIIFLLDPFLILRFYIIYHNVTRN